MPSGPRGVAALVAAIAPSDDTERAHRADVLAWLASTPDVYRPVFVAVTRTRGSDPHTDVTLWYLLAGNPALPIALDRREFAGGRWWTRPQLESAAPALFDPAMGRFLAKIRGQPRA